MSRILFLLLPLFLGVASCSPKTSGDGVVGDILFLKELNGGAKVEVVRGPRLALASCRAAISADSFEGARDIYPVRLQIRPPGGPPILLWSRIKSEYGDYPISDVMDVLDVAVDRERVVVVTAEDAAISVWFFGFYMGDSPRALLNPAEWDGASGPIMVSRDTVDAKLGKTADGLRLTVTVTERNQPEHRQTVYEQVSANGWPMEPQFKMVSQTPPLHPDPAEK